MLETSGQGICARQHKGAAPRLPHVDATGRWTRHAPAGGANEMRPPDAPIISDFWVARPTRSSPSATRRRNLPCKPDHPLGASGSASLMIQGRIPDPLYALAIRPAPRHARRT